MLLMMIFELRQFLQEDNKISPVDFVYPINVEPLFSGVQIDVFEKSISYKEKLSQSAYMMY